MDKIENKNKSNKYLVFMAAFLIIFSCAAISAFSVFKNQWTEMTGSDSVGFALSVYQFSMACFGIIGGIIYDKVGPKKLMYAGGLLFGAGWFFSAFATNIWMLYFTFGIIAGAGNGVMYSPALNTAIRWFPDKKGTISGLLLCSASLGPLFLSQIGTSMVNKFGANSFMYIGIFYLLVVWCVSWAMEVPSKEWEEENYPIKSTSSKETKDFSPKEMLSTGTFWFLIIIFAIGNTAGLMMIGNLSPIAQGQLALSEAGAATLVSINCIANFIGRLVMGRLCDKLGENKCLILIFILTIISLLGLSISSNVFIFTTFLVLLGGAFGGVLVVFPPLTSKTFGVKYAGTNYGIMFFGYSAGAFLGPYIAQTAKLDGTGVDAYKYVYLVAMIVAALGLILSLVLNMRKKKLYN